MEQARCAAVLMLVLLSASIAHAGISVGAITISPDDDGGTGGVQVNPAAGAAKQVNATATITETYGFGGINQAAGNGTCQWNYSGSTQLYSTNIVWSNCAGNTCDALCPADFQFYDNATDYNVTMFAYNTSDGSASGSALFTYAELAALSLSAGTLNFGGALAQGSGHGTSNKTQAVTNLGNVAIDIRVSGTAMPHASLSASLPVGSIFYDIVSNAMGSEAALTGSATTLSSFNLAKGASSTKDSWWDLHVPAGSSQWIPAGTYSGTVTITAIKDA